MNSHYYRVIPVYIKFIETFNRSGPDGNFKSELSSCDDHVTLDHSREQ